ncbi:uncharacterized protein LOC113331395 [Papaver somniferum]|uniref:uncharacterized protein LOC113331395 n=1 Tax=Papaver somniferum TaxID=3469 RepID=UPI000E6F47C7|nr:uncharacterized protein LOC113331395 [Papaver somniferum]
MDRFDGENPRGWVQKSERYFHIHSTEENQKVSVASIFLEGKADKWFLNFQIGKPFLSWRELADGVCARFENPVDDNFIGSFNKLCQVTTVEEYFEQFESLKALMLSSNPHLNEQYFVMSFISGLKTEIKNSVLMFQPPTLLQAFSLSRMQEQKCVQQPKPSKPFQRSFTNSFSNTRPYQASLSPFPPKPIQTTTTVSSPFTPKSGNSTPKSSPPLPPIKRLTQEQMTVRREKGLCYNCDVVYTPGHICKRQQLFMVQVEKPESSEEAEEEVFEETVESPVESDMDISLHALTGAVAGDTIRIPGTIKRHKVSILIDTGSTHSFIDCELARKLNCSISPTGHMLVIVVNGDKTNHHFTEDLRILPLGGCDMMLGAYWLRRLGDITFNFSKLSIAFKYQGKKIVLIGEPEYPTLSIMSSEAAEKYFSKNNHGMVGQLFSITPQSSSSLTPPSILPLLQEFQDIFEEPKQLPPTRNLDHTIPLKPNSTPTIQRPYKCPYTQKGVFEQLVKEMLNSGIIQPSHSPFASPIFLVKKKDNTWRFCVDYRKLNDITVKEKFPIPVVKELLDELNRAMYFTKIDLRTGYHQIRVHVADIHQTTFRTHQGHYEFKALMNEVFQEHLRKFILVFFDDILVYSSSLQEHLKHLQITFSLLRAHKIFAKLSKCCFGQTELEYLGHIITAEGVKTDPTKIACMKEWPTPTNIKELRGFLGLTGYYKKKFQGYGAISRPLTELLNKNSFLWSESATMAFEQLKESMTNTPVLALPYFSKQFTVETDVSDFCVGDVWTQEGKPIAFFSKGLRPRAKALSIYENELIDVVMDVNKWRRPHENAACSSLALSKPNWNLDILSSYAQYTKAQQLIAQTLASSTDNGKFSVKEEVLRYKEMIYVGNNNQVRSTILESIHTSAVGGHSSIQASYVRERGIFTGLA